MPKNALSLTLTQPPLSPLATPTVARQPLSLREMAGQSLTTEHGNKKEEKNTSVRPGYIHPSSPPPRPPPPSLSLRAVYLYSAVPLSSSSAAAAAAAASVASFAASAAASAAFCSFMNIRMTYSLENEDGIEKNVKRAEVIACYRYR